MPDRRVPTGWCRSAPGRLPVLALGWLLLVAAGFALVAPAAGQDDEGADGLARWAWKDRGDGFFFVRSAGERWVLPRVAAREWVLVNKVGLETGLALDDDAERLAARRFRYDDAKSDHREGRPRAEADDTWRTCLRKECWPAPSVGLVSVPLRVLADGESVLDTRPEATVAVHAAVTGRTFRAYYLVRLGREAWFYFEQLEPLPPGQTALTPEDVFRPEFLAAQRGAVAGEEPKPGRLMTRVLRRCRGFRADGPFEPVRILFCHVTLAETLDLRAPGYP